jgi:uncharacterized protein YycO
MKYKDARSTVNSGDVLAWTHRGVGSWHDFKIWLVRLFTQSEYVHVGVAWYIADRIFILEAVAAGVRIFPLSLDLPCYWLPWGPLRTDQLEFALSKAGQPYSYLECALGYLGGNDPADNSWECAEYVCTVLQLPCQATPSSVVNYLLQNGSTLTEIEP